jgi:cobalt-zinc-cadmium efflux system protein
MSAQDHYDDSGHKHGADLRDLSRRRLLIALALTASFLAVEVVAGIVSGSLALLSDAGHMLTDAGALGLALWAQSLSTRPRSDRKTFGYRRAEILAAAANGIVLGITAIAVIVEATASTPARTSRGGPCWSSRSSG